MKNFLAFGLGILLLLLSLVLGVSLGTEAFSVQEVMTALLHHTPEEIPSFAATIIR